MEGGEKYFWVIPAIFLTQVLGEIKKLRFTPRNHLIKVNSERLG